MGRDEKKRQKVKLAKCNASSNSHFNPTLSAYVYYAFRCDTLLLELAAFNLGGIVVVVVVIVVVVVVEVDVIVVDDVAVETVVNAVVIAVAVSTSDT